MTPLDGSRFATAKLNFLTALALDPDLPKLAIRVGCLLTGRYMHAKNGGEAWPKIERLCRDLGISSERALRESLYALSKRGHLIADRKSGKTTRYRISERYFEEWSAYHEPGTPARHEPGDDSTPAYHEPGTPARHEPGYDSTPARHEPGTPARHEPGTPAHHEPGYDSTPARHEPGTPARNEPGTPAHHEPGYDSTPARHEPGTPAHHEPPNTGKGIPVNESRKSSPLAPNGSAAARVLPSDHVEVLSFGATPKAFESFQVLWKWKQGESVKAARAAFDRLSEADREGAISGARSFQEAMADRRFRPHARAYLAERQWTFSPPAPPATMATSRNGVGMLLAESYGFGREHRPEKTIDLGAARVGDGAPCKSMAQRLPDGNFRLHPASDQLQAWRDFERREFGRARPGLVRRSEWPAESSAAAMQAGTAERMP